MIETEDKILEAIKNTSFICFCGEVASKNFSNKFNIKIACNKCNCYLINKIDGNVYINIYRDINNEPYGFITGEYQINDLDISITLEEILSIIKISDFAKIREKYDKYSLFI